MEFVVEESGRLDKFLAMRYAKFSRTRFQRLIKDSAIMVNGKIIYKSGLKLKIGDKVSVSDEAIHSIGKDFLIAPEKDISLEIIYEDKDIAVINKQAGLLVHPTANQRHHTLANALVAKYPKIINVGESPLRPGIVHRLDKDTSGLMAVAKNQKAFLFLKNQFLGRTVSKTYLALVEGIPAENEGVIRFSIRPSRTNRSKKVAVKKSDKSGKKSIRSAETGYLVKEKIGKFFSLVEAMPKTGRTHQIRVHLSAIGHPVVGDYLYSAKKNLAKRQMLHAYRIEFTAPNGRRLKLEAPMPEDMKQVISRLKEIKTAPLS